MYKNALLFLLLITLMSGCKPDKAAEHRFLLIEKRLEELEKKLAADDAHEDKQQSAYVIPVGDSPYLGLKDAKVNIVVFSNFQCPYCGRADKALREVIKDEALSQNTNVVFKHFPFDRHQHSRPAAKATLAAKEQGLDKFWAMSEKIFANQDKLSAENFKVWAKDIGLNLSKFEKDLAANDAAYEASINNDIKLGSEAAKLQGTPWIMINGWQFDGNLTAEDIKKFIAEKKLF